MAGKTILNIGRESRHAFLSLLRISKKIFQKTSKSKIIFKKAKPKEKISRRLEKTSEKDLINELRKRIKRGFISFFGVVQEAMKKTASPPNVVRRKKKSKTFHVSLAKLGKKKSKTFARKKKQKTTEELIEEARIKTLAKNKQRKTVGDLIEETKKSDEKKDNFKY